MCDNFMDKVEKLIVMYRNGELGGEMMPEDANPHLEKSSPENYLYFTLPMALNYQRNSYTLWESALKTYNDKETRFVFDPGHCIEKPFEEVQQALTRYKVAIQKNKQTENWLRLCETFVKEFDGDIRKLFDEQNNDVEKIRKFIQVERKKVCKATHRLGIITDDEYHSGNVQTIVIEAWNKLLKGTKYNPIDIHTPLWLWSRNGFKEI